MADQDIKKGDEGTHSCNLPSHRACTPTKPLLPVTWQYGSAAPSGTVAEVKAGDVSVTSKAGNEIKKHGTDEDPAVKVSRGGNDVVKNASELDVEQPAADKPDGAKDGAHDAAAEQARDEHKAAENGDKPTAQKAEETKDEKKANGQEKPAAAATEKKDKAKKPAAPAKEKKATPKPKETKADAKPKKRAATESGEPRRSKRNRT